MSFRDILGVQGAIPLSAVPVAPPTGGFALQQLFGVWITGALESAPTAPRKRGGGHGGKIRLPATQATEMPAGVDTQQLAVLAVIAIRQWYDETSD